MVFNFINLNFLLTLNLLSQILQELTLWLLNVIPHTSKSLHSSTSHLVHLIIFSPCFITIPTSSTTRFSTTHLILKRWYHTRHKCTSTITIWRCWHAWHKWWWTHILLGIRHHIHWLLLIILSPLICKLRRHKVLLKLNIKFLKYNYLILLLIQIRLWRRRGLVEISLAIVHWPLKILLITIPWLLHELQLATK